MAAGVGTKWQVITVNESALCAVASDARQPDLIVTIRNIPRIKGNSIYKIGYKVCAVLHEDIVSIY